MSPEVPHKITRSNSHWYSDGSVILQVEDTQFRLHQSLLSKHFPIFTDAFNFTGPREIEDVDGRPVVKVAGDRAMDWENMLIAVYDPYLSYSGPTDYPIPVLLSTLRLAAKYEANHLRNMAATCLRTILPASLTHCSDTPLLNPLEEPPFLDYIFDIVNIALEVGFQSILPGACLICIQFMGLSNIVDGHTRKDGTISSLSPPASRMLTLGWRSMTIKALDLLVFHPMTQFPIPANCQKSYWVDQPDPECEGRWFKCNVLTRDESNGLRMRSLAYNPANAFSGLDGTIDLCNVCTPLVWGLMEEGSKKLWQSLPLICGLPPWDELDDFNP